MIKAIVAIDEKRGLADDHGIPWRGKLPTDVKYYRDKIKTGIILMGYGFYKEVTRPQNNQTNYVATDSDEALMPGFQKVSDARAFLKEHANEEVWNGGGAGLYATTFDLVEELYVTQLKGDFHCTKFLPKYKDQFELVSETEPQTENGITFTFQVWKKPK